MRIQFIHYILIKIANRRKLTFYMQMVRVTG